MKRFFTLLLVLTVTLINLPTSNVHAQEKEAHKKYYEEYGVVAEKGGILIGREP